MLNKPSFAILAAAAGFVLLAAAGHAQERIVNGEMATFSSGVPDGWVQSDPPAARLTSSLSGTNSPFTNRYTDNGFSWLLDDDLANGVDGYIQNGYAGAPQIALNFDFRLDSLVAGGTWGVQYNNTGSATPNVSLIHFRIDTNFYTAPYDGSTNANVAQAPILALSANVWYNVQAFIDVPLGIYGGTITAFGGSTTPFNGTINTTGLNALVISGTQVRDRTANVENSTVLFDNLSVVPEPASAALLGVSGLTFLLRRRR